MWFHLVAAGASVEVLLTVVLVDHVFAWYYVLIVVYAAYVFSTRAELAVQVAFTCAVAAAPAVAGMDGFPAVDILVMVPTLIVAAAVVRLLHDRLERSEAGYRTLSRMDPLTGVGNYRQLQETLAQQVAGTGRERRRFALLLVDLDDFKSINDRNGHLEGDRVLREVAETLTGTVRDGDLVSRHGGDEFSVVAPGAREEDARELAGRIAEAVSKISSGGRTISAGCGVAVFPADGRTPDELVGAADRDLMGAKSGEPAVSPG